MFDFIAGACSAFFAGWIIYKLSCVADYFDNESKTIREHDITLKLMKIDVDYVTKLSNGLSSRLYEIEWQQEQAKKIKEKDKK